MIHHSAGPQLKVWRQSAGPPGGPFGRGRDTNLEVVLLGFAPHDDVERLVRVLGAALDAVGHVLLVLVGVEPHAEGAAVSAQLGPRLGSCGQREAGGFGAQLLRWER